MVQTNAIENKLLQAECWVFDLDNTLYPASCDLFAQVDEKMTRFIAEYLGLDFVEAGRLRKSYYLEHGTTLSGMMTRHDMKPEEFLDYVHDIDLGGVTPDPFMDRALGRLRGRKIVFTNANTNHAERVLDRLSIRHHFEAVFDIVGADFIPKPEPKIYDVLVDRHQLTPGKTVMVEDLVRNLGPAAALGMTTVWVRPDTGARHDHSKTDDVHHVVDDLGQWLDALTAE